MTSSTLLEHDSYHSLDKKASKAALCHAVLGGHIDTDRAFITPIIEPDLMTLATSVYNGHYSIHDMVLREAQFLIEPNDQVWPHMLH
jgi:hypothetical protein